MWANRFEREQNPCEPDTRPVALEHRVVLWTDDPAEPPTIVFPTPLHAPNPVTRYEPMPG